MAGHYLNFSPEILHVLANSELVLLDARSNHFLLFDEQASREIVDGMVGVGMTPLVEQLRGEGLLTACVARPRINRSDAPGLDDFSWSESVRHKAKHHRGHPGAGQVVVAFLTLARVCLMLKTASLFRLLQDRHGAGAPCAAMHDVVDREISALLRATRWLPCKVACLQFTLALRERLARHGLFGTVEIGVQTYSFMAHAWLELGGQPVGEPTRVSQSLHRLRCPA